MLAVKIGGRGHWRVERSELEAYIARLYGETQATDTVVTEQGAEVPVNRSA